jgi:LysM repeat protein
MAGAAGAPFGGIPSHDRGARRGRKERREAAGGVVTGAPGLTSAELMVAVPQVCTQVRLPRPARGRSEWATSQRRYRVRAGWHVARVSDNVVDLLTLIDGRRTVTELAEELAARQGREVHPAEVAYLLRRRLVSAGLVALGAGVRVPLAADPVYHDTVATTPLAAAPPRAAVESRTSPALDLAVDEMPTAPLSAVAAVLPELPAPVDLPTEPVDRAPVPDGSDETSAGKRGAEVDRPPAALEPLTLSLLIEDQPTIILPRIALASAAEPDSRVAGATAAPTDPVVGVRRPRQRLDWLGEVGVRLAVMVGLACLGFALVVALRLVVNVPSSAHDLPSASHAAHAAARVPTARPPAERLLVGERAYVVEPGDTLATIATQFGVSPEALLLVNAYILPEQSALVPGMRLAVPSTYRPGILPAAQPRPLYYVVQRGDTLYDIGIFFGISWQAIAQYNHLADPPQLDAGDGLVIPPAGAP